MKVTTDLTYEADDGRKRFVLNIIYRFIWYLN